MRTLVWFRGKDLRVTDHAPLADALDGGEVVCVFVLDPFFFAPDRARELPHRMQFLLDSIAGLAQSLDDLGSELVLVEGKSIEVIPKLARAWRVDRVVGQRWTEPFARKRDAIVTSRLEVPFELFEGELLAPPASVRTAGGKPFSVFSPFARAFRASVRVDAPLSAPKKIPPLPAGVTARRAKLPTLASLGIPRNPRVLPGGEPAARERLTRFLRGPAAGYPEGRNALGEEGTSRLSVDLKFGTLSPRTVWVEARRALEKRHPEAWKIFSNELLWREFNYSVLWVDPELLERPHRREFERFPWQKNEAGWKAWVEGRTGYPVVDASARQLLREGFVHNRARMISASFLTKDLLIDYRRGEAHYLAYLTDGDWANNNAGWQWTTGCGFDAAPYFRVFNPVEQAKRFDPEGAYVRKYVPEIAALPDRYIHEPWSAPPDVLRAARVTLGKTYPRPIVDHGGARKRFLALASDVLQRR